MAYIFYRKNGIGKEPYLIDADDYRYMGRSPFDEPETIYRELKELPDNAHPLHRGPRPMTIGDLILTAEGAWLCCKRGWQNATMFFDTKAFDAVMSQLFEMTGEPRPPTVRGRRLA